MIDQSTMSDNSTPCPTCNGRGERGAATLIKLFGGLPRQEWICPTCNGTGEADDE